MATFISLRQYTEQFGGNLHANRRLCQLGRIPAYRPSKNWLIDIEAIHKKPVKSLKSNHARASALIMLIGEFGFTPVIKNRIKQLPEALRQRVFDWCGKQGIEVPDQLRNACRDPFADL